MKNKEELNALKEEVETVNKKLHEMTDEELAQVSGGDGQMGYFALRCSNPDCYSHTISSSFTGATPGVLCQVCKIGTIEKIITG